MASSVTSQVAAAKLRQCGHCRSWKSVCDESRLWGGWFYCSYDCTAYAKKRRLLRRHRENMRVMADLIQEHGLDQELEERLIEQTGNNFHLADHDFMDEDSDQADPEAALRRELTGQSALRQEQADQSAFVEAASGALQYRKVATDLERARMMLEDVCSRQLQ